MLGLFERGSAALYLAAALALVAAPPSVAQESRAQCLATHRQCVAGCRFTGVMGADAGNACRASCNDKLRSCMAPPAPGQQPGAGTAAPQRQAGRNAAPENAPSPAPAPVAAAPTPTPARAPGDLAYEGPPRFFPEYMATGGREGTRDDASPLAGEERGPLARGVLNSSLSSPIAPRNVPAGAWEAAQAELKALAAAGYESIDCNYGPMVVRGGYSRASFWFTKRAVVSDPLLAAVRKYNGNDAAVAQCPRTWGEARAIASGQAEPPSAAEVAAVAAASASATGMRHVPTLAGSGKFDDDRPLHQGMEWSALSIFSQADAPGSRPQLQEQKPNLLRDTMLALDAAGQRIFVCQYLQEAGWQGAATVAAFSPAGTGPTTAARVQELRFWARQRPADVREDFLRLAGRSDRDRAGALLDLPVERCPGTYGEAMALVDGSEAAKATAREAAARSASVTAALRQSDADDRAMLRDIEADVARLESGIDGLVPDVYRNTVSGSLKEKLNRVAGSAIARVRAIPAGASGRAAFDAWDRDYGAPLLRAVSRLFIVAKRKAFPLENGGGFKFSDLKKDQATLKREQQEWVSAARAQLYTRPIWHALVDAYGGHEPLIDAAFIDKARRAALKLPPAPPRAETTVTVTRTYFGTPGQIAAMKMVDDLGDAATSLQQLKAAIAALHARVGATREAFWACYARRCAEAGKLYAAYSAALLDKDYILLGQPALSRKIEQMVGSVKGAPTPPMFQDGVMQGLTASMGSNGVDNGILLGCEAAAATFQTALDRRLRDVGIVAAGNVLQKAFFEAEDTAEFRDWHACRDRMEVLYRPRR